MKSLYSAVCGFRFEGVDLKGGTNSTLRTHAQTHTHADNRDAFHIVNTIERELEVDGTASGSCPVMDLVLAVLYLSVLRILTEV